MGGMYSKCLRRPKGDTSIHEVAPVASMATTQLTHLSNKLDKIDKKDSFHHMYRTTTPYIIPVAPVRSNAATRPVAAIVIPSPESTCDGSHIAASASPLLRHRCSIQVNSGTKYVRSRSSVSYGRYTITSTGNMIADLHRHYEARLMRGSQEIMRPSGVSISNTSQGG